MTATLYCGDARDVLQRLPSGSVQAVITSPPYWGLRDYGVDGQMGLEQTPAEYVAGMVAVFREVKRVLRPDGTLWLNLGDSYAGGGRGGNPADSSFRKQATNIGSLVAPTPVPDGLKPKDLVGIPWRVAFALQDDGWWLRSDIIWCLSGGTRVYAKTQKGVMPATLKDLVRLDPATVQLWNGEKWTQVLGWSETTRPDDALEIELRSGERIGSTVGHQWPTTEGLKRTADLRVGDVLKTTWLPGQEKIADPEHIPDEIGWFVGLYIAEGHRNDDAIIISGHTKETNRHEHLRRFAEQYHGSFILRQHSDNSTSVVLHGPILHGIIDTYVVGNSADTKHLHSRCWQRGNGFLRSVMAGYLHGDGHLDTKNNRWRLGFCQNDAWANDLRTVCARVGYSVRLRRCQHQSGGRRFPGWRGELKEERGTHHNTRHDAEIVAIRRSRARKFWDIGVADEPHTFALASGVLTHNSKPNPMPESVRDRPTKAHEYLFLLTKQPRYFYDADAIAEPLAVTNAQRTTAHYDTTERYGAGNGGNGGLDSLAARMRLGDVSTRNKRSVWTVPTQSYKHAHFACFPEALIEPCILAGTSERGCCPECGAPWRRVVERESATPGQRVGYLAGTRTRNDGERAGHFTDARSNTLGWEPTCTHDAEPVPCTVLDPFSGAGTVGVVALRHGRNYIGVELNPEYVEMSRRRIHGDAPLLNVVEATA